MNAGRLLWIKECYDFYKINDDNSDQVVSRCCCLHVQSHTEFVQVISQLLWHKLCKSCWNWFDRFQLNQAIEKMQVMMELVWQVPAESGHWKNASHAGTGLTLSFSWRHDEVFVNVLHMIQIWYDNNKVWMWLYECMVWHFLKKW